MTILILIYWVCWFWFTFLIILILIDFIKELFKIKIKTPPALPADTITGTTSYSGSKGLVFCKDCRWLVGDKSPVCIKKLEPTITFNQALGDCEVKTNYAVGDYKKKNKKNNCEFWEQRPKS